MQTLYHKWCIPNTAYHVLVYRSWVISKRIAYHTFSVPNPELHWINDIIYRGRRGRRALAFVHVFLLLNSALSWNEYVILTFL
jgi:hypothetical protein